MVQGAAAARHRPASRQADSIARTHLHHALTSRSLYPRRLAQRLRGPRALLGCSRVSAQLTPGRKAGRKKRAQRLADGNTRSVYRAPADACAPLLACAPLSQPSWEPLSLETKFWAFPPQMSPSQTRAAQGAPPAPVRGQLCIQDCSLRQSIHATTPLSDATPALSKLRSKSVPRRAPRQGPRPCPALALRAGQELVVLAVG